MGSEPSGLCRRAYVPDALQEARRAEQEQERAKEFEELRKAKVRPAFADGLLCMCRRAYVPDALQEARRAERTQLQEQERKKERDDRNVRPDCVLCFARRD